MPEATRVGAVDADEEVLQVIADATPGCVAYVDAQRRCLFMNRAFRARMGVDGDARGRALEEILDGATYGRIRPHIERALIGESVAFELAVPAPDERACWLQVELVPHTGADGRVRGVVSQVEDITQRKRDQRQATILAESARTLAACTAVAPMLAALTGLAVPQLGDWAMVLLAEQGPAAVHIEPGAAGASEMLSRCASAFAGSQLVARVMRDASAVTVRAPDPELSELGCDPAASAVTCVALVARGRARGVLVLGAAQPGAFSSDELALLEELGRRAGAALETVTLLEAERRINEQLTEAVARQRAADRRKDEFLAMLGHELRNPLAPILTALELIELRGETRFVREREVIKRQASHLARLVEDLLDISRAMSDKLQLRREPVELAEIVLQAIETVSPLLEQRQHAVINRIPRRGLRVYADVMRLGQVFGNLLMNAAKYTEPGGRIELTATAEDDTIEVAVADNGCGIQADLMAHLFEPFVQGQRTLDRAQGGIGVGLALVRNLTQLHGGSVTVHSDGPGTGSRFVVRLPALRAVDVSDDEDSTQRMCLVVQPSGRVLVVDDNIDVADMLAAVLRSVGYEVATAHDAPSALQLASEFRPQIALLDLGLPVMDGYELARHLRERLAEAPPRLVAVSGYGQDADVARSRAAGFDSHLGKPVSVDILVNVLGYLQPAQA